MRALTIILAVAAALILVAVFVKERYSINPPMEKVNPLKSVDVELENLQLPAGFKVEMYASKVSGARSMTLSPSGTLYVGTQGDGNVYALRDLDGDFKVDQTYTIFKKGNQPNGVAFRDGDLYIAEIDRILKFTNIESKLDNPGEAEVVYDKLPKDRHHGWKYINFGPDGKLYIPIGAPCNICEPKSEEFAAITRMNPDGTGFEVVHKGIRNTVGFDWHPTTGELWFTDNGRDMMGDNMPNCELNKAPKDGMHFGYPYCHQGDTPDPEFGKGKNCSDYTAPVAKLGPHTAPLGMEFYTGSAFPATYKNAMFIARHGSWNRSEKIGYDVVVAREDSKGVVTYEPFLTGFLSADKKDVSGRPVDIEFLPDGSMLVSDDFADAIYRITYTKPGT